MCHMSYDVEASKLLKMLQTWPMVTVGAGPDENSKTFERKLMGVQSPLPAPFEIRHLVATRNASVEDSGAKLCHFCA
jgi:hypothetical protein